MLNKNIHTGRHKGIGVLLLGVLVYYFASISLFVHSHVINGVTIAHSHIHGSKHHQSKSGNHTEIEITLISALSHIQAEQTQSNDIDLAAPCINVEHNAYECSPSISSNTYPCHFGRAPPAHIG